MFDKDKLFERGLPEADVETPLGTMRVRGLSQAEAHKVEQVKDSTARERRILALALLDPVLTEDEVGKWQQSRPAGEITPVALKVAELSGMLEGSGKEPT